MGRAFRVEILHRGAKVIPAVGKTFKLVEARARWREQHDVAGFGTLPSNRHCGAEIFCAIDGNAAREGIFELGRRLAVQDRGFYPCGSNICQPVKRESLAATAG